MINTKDYINQIIKNYEIDKRKQFILKKWKRVNSKCRIKVEPEHHWLDSYASLLELTDFREKSNDV